MSDAGLWRYRAALQRIVDADTLALVADLGFHISFVDLRVRLFGLNAPEHNTEAGRAAIAYVRQWCELALQPQTPWELRIETVKDRQEKYGRYLARVSRAIDGRVLNDDLIAAGHAVSWDGRGPKPTPGQGAQP